MKEIKSILYKHCQSYLQQKIERTQQAIDDAQEAANTETKSSAGDKHETGRAMMQLEIEQLSGQLLEWVKMRQELDAIDAKKPCDVVGPGALVFCDSAVYYLAIAAGKIIQEGKTYFAISPSSPIGELLMNKKAGDSIDFRGKKVVINSIL